jgi:dTDP-glucose 4,6-dehydratase
MASTSEIYGDPLLSPQVETYWGNVNPVGERSCYDEAKRFSEALCFAFKSEHDANIGVLRIFNTYGPRLDESDGRVVSNFIHAAINNNPLRIYGSGMQTRSLCFVSDLVKGILKMGELTTPGPINLGNPYELTILDLAQKILKLTNSNSELQFFPALSDDPQRRCPDISKAIDILKWKPETSLDDGLEVTINWFINKRRAS